jgi:hypothetical protein
MLTARDTLSMIPTPTRQVVSDDPPTLTNGKAMPVKGIVPVTTAMLSSA